MVLSSTRESSALYGTIYVAIAEQSFSVRIRCYLPRRDPSMPATAMDSLAKLPGGFQLLLLKPTISPVDYQWNHPTFSRRPDDPESSSSVIAIKKNERIRSIQSSIYSMKIDLNNS